MRAIPALLLALIVAGCTAPSAPEAQGGMRVNVEPPSPLAPASTRVSEPARDGEAPPLTTEAGEASFAAAMLVREALAGRGERHPCGGVVLAVPQGAPDPRGELDRFVLAEDVTLLEETGRSWVTERFVARDDASRALWVQNVGGGASYKDDDGAHCPAPVFGAQAWNVLLHADGPERLDVWFSPAARPHRGP